MRRAMGALRPNSQPYQKAPRRRGHAEGPWVDGDRHPPPQKPRLAPAQPPSLSLALLPLVIPPPEKLPETQSRSRKAGPSQMGPDL